MSALVMIMIIYATDCMILRNELHTNYHSNQKLQIFFSSNFPIITLQDFPWKPHRPRAWSSALNFPQKFLTSKNFNHQNIEQYFFLLLILFFYIPQKIVTSPGIIILKYSHILPQKKIILALKQDWLTLRDPSSDFGTKKLPKSQFSLSFFPLMSPVSPTSHYYYHFQQFKSRSKITFPSSRGPRNFCSFFA